MSKKEVLERASSKLYNRRLQCKKGACAELVLSLELRLEFFQIAMQCIGL